MRADEARSRTAGYSKWDGGIIGWTFHAYGTTDGTPSGPRMYTVTAQASDDYAALMVLSTLSYTPTQDSAIPAASLVAGRYLRVSWGSCLASLLQLSCILGCRLPSPCSKPSWSLVT